jgi:hypothetical protein
MANKQPWYHEVQILYTSTKGDCLSAKKREAIAVLIESIRSVVKNSVEVLESEPEPGDPADLL